MSSFHNSHQVNNQAGHQNVYGGIHHYHHPDDTARVKRPRLGRHDYGSIQSLDDDILDSLAFPEMHLRRGGISEPHQKTCQWLYDLQEYKTWQSQRSGLLWVKGKPGAGKSTLMAHIYHQTVRQDRSDDLRIDIAFFFTARGAPLQHTPLGMLRSLLNQIFSHDVGSRDDLRRSYQEKQASFGNDHRVWEWQQPELEKLLAETVLALAKHKQLVIFIDALDEAGEQAARDTARYFHNLNDRVLQQMAKVKICISCRHYPVVPKFQALEIQVEKHNYGDIKTYVTNHLDIRNHSGNGTYECTEWKNLIQSLVETARGVFQWVHVVMPMVEELILEGRSPRYIQNRLKTVPKELGQMYESILKRLINKSDGAQTRRLFQWVCLATRPLSVTEMRYALASHKALDRSLPTKYGGFDDFSDSDETMKSYIRSWSGGLIEVTAAVQSGVPVVQPIHQSVNDFCLVKGLELLTRHNAWRQDVAVTSTVDIPASETVANCHGELYWCCLKYMSEDAVDCVSIDLSSYNWVQKVRYRSDMRARFPLLEYARLNYLIHAKNAHGHRSRDLSTEAQVIARCVPILIYINTTFSSEYSRYNEFLRPCATTLHIAAAAGLIDLTRHLLEHVTDVDMVDKHGRTALHVAAAQGHPAVVEILIDNKACVQKMTGAGSTPLVLAAARGHVEVFLLLMKQGARIDLCAGLSGTALYAAASCGIIAITRLCIEAGADVNATNIGFGTALQIASGNGHKEVVQMLLDAGADVNALGGREFLSPRERRGFVSHVEGRNIGTALQVASGNGHKEVVQMLLAAGADVNAPRGRDIGGPFEIRNSGTALQLASGNGHKEVVQMLLVAGADINASRRLFGTALHEASGDGHKEVVQMLLAAGADINASGGLFGSALQEASHMGQQGVVQILLAAGADVNAPKQEAHGTVLQDASKGQWDSTDAVEGRSRFQRSRRKNVRHRTPGGINRRS